MRRAREYLPALGLLVAGAVASIVLAGVTWANVELTGVLGTDEVPISGTELVPAAQAAGWLGLAAVVAIHATRGIGRAIIGVLLLVTGLGVTVWAGRYAVDMEAAVDVVSTGDAVPALVDTAPAAAIGTAVAGALIAVVGALTVLRGSRWPAMGRKYERAGAMATRGANTARDAWDALDRGDDPTTWLRGTEQTRQNGTDATNGPGRRTRP